MITNRHKIIKQQTQAGSILRAKQVMVMLGCFCFCTAITKCNTNDTSKHDSAAYKALYDPKDKPVLRDHKVTMEQNSARGTALVLN